MHKYTRLIWAWYLTCQRQVCSQRTQSVLINPLWWRVDRGGVWERDRRARIEGETSQETFVLVIAGEMGGRWELTEKMLINIHPRKISSIRCWQCLYFPSSFLETFLKNCNNSWYLADNYSKKDLHSLIQSMRKKEEVSVAAVIQYPLIFEFMKRTVGNDMIDKQTIVHKKTSVFIRNIYLEILIYCSKDLLGNLYHSFNWHICYILVVVFNVDN